ncbi:hypothetical protein PR048_028119 [Dryococelus australis]|uniref:Sensory neuron membrane protein 1 n=1 Tax=Dryococelus australis TaxID=614101 RepID=A0ABQ9GIF3_9NEOP|nr:hypothetical protein PR048_028119 [Dryococelus australis]
MKVQGKREIPEEIRRLAVSSSAISTCRDPGVTQPGIEPGSPWWEASSLTAQPPLPHSGSPSVDDRPIMNAVKCRVLSGVVRANRTMASSNTDANRTGVLAVVDVARNNYNSVETLSLTFHGCKTAHQISAVRTKADKGWSRSRKSMPSAMLCKLTAYMDFSKESSIVIHGHLALGKEVPRTRKIPGTGVIADLGRAFDPQKVVLVDDSPAFERWRRLPQPLVTKFYLFNVTNPDEVQNGSRPVLHELGPYVYDEHIERVDVVKNQDGETISYNLKSTFFFNQELSSNKSTSENVTIINLPLLGSALKVKKYFPFALKMMEPILAEIFPYSDSIFLTGTVAQLLFEGMTVINCSNARTEIAEIVCDQLESQMPDTVERTDENTFKFSFYHYKNGTSKARYTVDRGLTDSRRLAQVVAYDGEDSTAAWLEPRCNRVNGTDGIFFSPLRTPDDPLVAFSSDICSSSVFPGLFVSRYPGLVVLRSVTLKFERKSEFRGLPVLRYVNDPALLGDPEKYPDNKCYCVGRPDYRTCLKGGVLDLSPCAGKTTRLLWIVQASPDDETPGIDCTEDCNFTIFKRTGVAVILSYPHLYMADPEYLQYAEGISPERRKHETFLEVEPGRLELTPQGEKEMRAKRWSCYQLSRKLQVVRPCRCYHMFLFVSEFIVSELLVIVFPHADKYKQRTGIPLRGSRKVQLNMFLTRIPEVSVLRNVSEGLFPAMWMDEVRRNGRSRCFSKWRFFWSTVSRGKCIEDCECFRRIDSDDVRGDDGLHNSRKEITSKEQQCTGNQFSAIGIATTVELMRHKRLIALENLEWRSCNHEGIEVNDKNLVLLHSLNNMVNTFYTTRWLAIILGLALCVAACMGLYSRKKNCGSYDNRIIPFEKQGALNMAFVNDDGTKPSSPPDVTKTSLPFHMVADSRRGSVCAAGDTTKKESSIMTTDPKRKDSCSTLDPSKEDPEEEVKSRSPAGPEDEAQHGNLNLPDIKDDTVTGSHRNPAESTHVASPPEDSGATSRHPSADSNSNVSSAEDTKSTISLRSVEEAKGVSSPGSNVDSTKCADGEGAR